MFGKGFGAPEIILILVVVLLLFGAKRLPETARGLGRSLRIFKSETKGLRDDDAADETPKPLPPAPTTEAAPPVQQAPVQAPTHAPVQQAPVQQAPESDAPR